MHAFNDHFSARAPAYARYRPRYPEALFAWLSGIVPSRAMAWDCGTGSGQAATALIRHFDHVVASDPSTSQLREASRLPGLDYVAMTAEQVALRGNSASLATAAQALHWFDAGKFFSEARRVLVPRGVLAVWSYGLCEIEPAIDKVVSHFYTDALGRYWPPERAMVDEGYASVSIPFREISSPAFSMEHRWSLNQVLGYLSTWSAVSLSTADGRDPMPEIKSEMAGHWGPAAEARVIRWPIALRVAIRE